MSAYLPSPHNLIGAAGLTLTLALFLVLGTAATGRRAKPEIALVAGWGLACLVFTTWGVLTPWSLLLPAVALGVTALGLAAVAWLGRAGRGKTTLPLPQGEGASPSRPCSYPDAYGAAPPIPRLAPVTRILLLTLPLWLVMLSVRPSQIDTWLNLLPNAAYLFDHDLLPTALGPPSYSFLPVAPYNTQFVAYLASLASGALAEGAMSLFNIALLCASGLLFARVVAATNRTPPWWACAVGLLVAVPLNPGFVPRDFLSPYGEASLAVTTLFAVWLAAEMLGDLTRGVAWPKSIPALALVLVALVNIKQSGVGLLVPIGLSLLALAWADPRIQRRGAVVAILVTLTPSVALFLLWRGFAVSAFVAGELEPLPLAAWNIMLLPQIIAGMLVAMFQKATFFLCVATVLAIAAMRLRRDPWSREGHLFGLIAGVTVLFTGFLLFTYVAHFPPDWAVRAHSFFRYESQISLLVMLGLVVALRPVVAGWLAVNARRARLAARAPVAFAPVALILLLPVAAAPLLRFDVDTPQPEVWALGHAAAAYVQPGDRLALVVPGDADDAVGSILRGVLLFTPPRRPGLDFRIETATGVVPLQEAAAAGYRLALMTCTPSGLDGVPAGVAAMLQDTPDGWRALRTWPWPDSIKARRFAAMLGRAPFCGVLTKRPLAFQ